VASLFLCYGVGWLSVAGCVCACGERSVSVMKVVTAVVTGVHKISCILYLQFCDAGKT
jgi:hypothetical protein